MEELLFSLITFVFVYLIYLVLVIIRKRSMKKYRNSTEVRYLEARYHLNMDKMNLTKLAHTTALTNAFIISVVIFVIGFIPNMALKMLVGFVLLIPLILLMYHIIGTYYKKKEGK